MAFRSTGGGSPSEPVRTRFARSCARRWSEAAFAPGSSWRDSSAEGSRHG